MSELVKADIGMIGLAVMGENLVLNMESKGFSVAVYNRTADRTTGFIDGRAKGKRILPAYSVEEFCRNLETPRRIMLMVKAGSAVDTMIAQLLPHLQPGDIIIDGGNSYYQDTERRVRELADKQIRFVGSGVSGGEEGALHGPSLMPGGNKEAWPLIEPVFKKIAASAPDGSPCCEWIGGGGSGPRYIWTSRVFKGNHICWESNAGNCGRSGMYAWVEDADQTCSNADTGEVMYTCTKAGYRTSRCYETMADCRANPGDASKHSDDSPGTPCPYPYTSCTYP